MSPRAIASAPLTDAAVQGYNGAGGDAGAARPSLATPGRRTLLVAAVALIGLNLRPFITGVGPLAPAIQADAGLSLQGMSLLTLAPMLLMGLIAFAGPGLQASVGARRTVIASLVVIGAGSLLRLIPGPGWLLVATAALIGLGVAVVQAVFPGVIKQQFPHRVGAVTGLYASMLMCGGALGAQLSPLATALAGSWRVGLAVLALPALAAVALAAVTLPANGASPSARANPAWRLIKRPRVWLLMACFGLVNGGYSSIVAWLSPSWQELGWGSAASGSLLALMAASQALAALLLPVLASGHNDRRPWLWLTLALQVVGFTGLALWPTAAPAGWTIIVGAGLGGWFALAMVTALDHAPDPVQAGALSALMQGGGFLLAALPPWIIANLHDLTGGYAAGWLMHAVSAVIVAALTVRLAPRHYARALALDG